MSEGLYASLSAMTCAIGTRPLWTPTRSCTTSRSSLCRRFTIMLMYSLLSVPRPLLDHEELRHPADQVGPAWEERKRHYDSLLRTPWQCLLLQRKARLPVQPHLTTLASIPVQMGLLQLELLSSIFVFFKNFHSKVGPALLRSTLDGLIEQVATFGARTLVLLLRDHPKWMDRRMLMGQNELWHLSALISLLFRRSPFHEISRCLKFTDRRVEFDWRTQVLSEIW